MTRTADSLPGSCPPRSLHEMTGRELDSFLSALPVANLQSLLRAHHTGHGAFFWRYGGVGRRGWASSGSCEARGAMILGSPEHLAWIEEQNAKQVAYERSRREWCAENNLPWKPHAMRGTNPGKHE